MRLHGKGEEGIATKMVASEEITDKNKDSYASADIVGSPSGICRTKRSCHPLFISECI